jgi:type IV pilus assembly protein PilA
MSDGKKGVPIWLWILAAVPVLVVGLGIVAALAIYGVRKYVTNAKQAEARTALANWANGLVTCGQRDGHLPPTSTPVPAKLSHIKAMKWQSAPTEWSEPGYRCAGFSMTEPQYFQYQWELRSPNEGTARAVADLNGDGIADTTLGVQVTCSAGTCRAGSVLSADDEPKITASSADEPSSKALPAAPGIVPPLTGDAVDLSTVMGRARKLANAWQPEAALLGIEATLVDGKIQAQDGASAKLTFGPSAFDTTKARSGLFVVVYDRTGINGAPAAGKAGKILPEPMCAPERVLARLTTGGEGPTTLRYGLDSAQRPMWMANSLAHPKELRLFDPQDCSVRGFVGPRREH